MLEQGHSGDPVVHFLDPQRANAEAIAAVRFDTPTGQRVPLSQLATGTVDRGPNSISRGNVQRKFVVQANVAGRYFGSTIGEIRRDVTGQISIRPGYFVEYGGQFEAQAEATGTLGALSLLAVAAIFVILYAEFRSARTATLVMANLPLALIGGVVAVQLTGRVVSIASLVGFVTLLGIATRNRILLVAHYRRLLAEGAPFRAAVVPGLLKRLSHTMMMALTAGLALTPSRLAAGGPATRYRHRWPS